MNLITNKSLPSDLVSVFLTKSGDTFYAFFDEEGKIGKFDEELFNSNLYPFKLFSEEVVGYF